MHIITDYTPEDYEGVWALHQKTVRENEGFVKNLAFHTDIHNIPRVYKAFFVIRDRGQIIGMVGIKQIDAETLEVKRLQVATSHQRQGLARKLMEHVFDYARKNGTRRLCLDASEPQAVACKLYESMGFRVTHTETRFLGPDKEEFLSTYMEKELEE